MPAPESATEFMSALIERARPLKRRIVFPKVPIRASSKRPRAWRARTWSGPS